MIRVNLLGLPKPKKRAPAVSMEGWVPLAFLLVALVLVGGGEYWRYGRLQEQGRELTMQTQKLQVEKEQLEKVQREYETNLKRNVLLAKRQEIIKGLEDKQSGPARLLETLASTVSNTDSLWLTSFDLVGEKITIEGVALNEKAVADFLTHLKETKAFLNVDLKETYQDTGTEIQKFLFTVNAQQPAPTPTS